MEMASVKDNNAIKIAPLENSVNTHIQGVPVFYGLDRKIRTQIDLVQK